MNFFYRFISGPLILLFACINFSFSQNIILTTGDNLLSLDPDSAACTVKTINTFCPALFLSAALFKDTLYYIGSDYHIYMFVLGDPTTCKFFNIITRSNALTTDKEGNLYWFADASGDLIKFNPHTGSEDDLGHVNYPSAGDLMFYKDKLYLASFNENLVEINLQDPESSTVYMNTPGHSFFGLVNIPLGCSQNKVYGVEADASDLRLSHLVEIDMENKKTGQTLCSVPYIILDAASITENGTYKVDINDIKVHSDCIPGSHNNNIIVKASTASSDSIYFSLNDSVKNVTGIFQNLAKGTYHISAEAAGCIIDTAAVVNDVTLPELEVSTQSPDCFNRPTGSIQLNTGNDSLFSTSLNNSTFTGTYFYPGLTSGLYKVVLKDGNGCAWDTTVSVPAFAPHKPVINYTATSPQCWQSYFGKIKLNISGEENPYTFLIDGNTYNSGHEVAGLLPSDYPVKISNRNNCVVDSMIISLRDNSGNYNCDTVYVPTAFTPNHDGKNDLLKPVIGGFPKTVFFTVYNRLGQPVFSTRTINEGWNGTYKGQPQLTGTYVWILQYSVNNITKSFKGTTVLIR